MFKFTVMTVFWAALGGALLLKASLWLPVAAAALLGLLTRALYAQALRGSE